MLYTLSLVAALVASIAEAEVSGPTPSLLSNIPAEASHDERKALIEKRLAERFAVGRAERGLEPYLRKQGFKTKRVTNSEAAGQPVYGEARIRYGRGLCKQTVGVFWRADPKGVLTEFYVNHGADLCMG